MEDQYILYFLIGAGLLTLIGILVFFRVQRQDQRQEEKLSSKEHEELAPSHGEPATTLEKALRPTKDQFLEKIRKLFLSSSQIPALEDVEELLYTSDLGPRTVQLLMERLSEKLSRKEWKDFESLSKALKDELRAIIFSVHDKESSKEILLKGLFHSDSRPCVWLVVGVNGAGKTTSIGKLAHLCASKGLKVLVAAGDTFRAAASSQLSVWSERAKVEIFSPPGEGKPSGVAFDACQKAVSEKFDVLIVDTAGRLHTQQNLMEELKKIKRVIEKAIVGAPQEVLLVLDASSGQNALVQAKQFHEALGITGVILTKLDGTAKGGVIIGLSNELQIPVKAIGVGEKMGDLKAFSPQEFVDSIL